MEKQPFEYEYTAPCLDWYEIKKVKLEIHDYYYFRLERRFGPSWWLIGINPIEKPNYHWKETEISEIYERDLKRFIEWAKTEKGNKIIEIKVISGSFNLFKEIESLF